MRFRLNNETMGGKAITEMESRIDANSDLIQTVVDILVETYCSDLDKYVLTCRTIITDTEQPPTDTELDDMVLTLPTLMYFTSEAQENLGIKEDVANAIRLEAFNAAYEYTDGTVKSRQAAAELASADETLVAIAYSRAYKKIKQRLDYAMEILQSCKKVMSRRVAELAISQVDGGRSY